jgi:enterochelin esterase-like enzyme
VTPRQRLALIAMCLLISVVLVGVALHTSPRTGGTGATGATANAAGHGPTEPAGTIRLLADPSWASRSQWSVRGRLESVDLTGGRSALSEHAFVYLPPQYYQPGFGHTRFPALEVMSGYPGSEPDMTRGMDYEGVLLNLIDTKRAAPTVLVMLLPNVTYPHDTECTDVPNGPAAATFYFQDLPAVIEHSYRVLARGWGAIGGSTGGYCAVKFAMLHPDVCPAAVSIQGYYFAWRDNTTGDLWGGSDARRDLNDLEWRLAHLPAPPVSLFLVSSYAQTGHDGYRDTQKFAALAKPPTTVQTVIYPHGGHNIATWRIGLAGELAWLISKLPRPAA